MDGCNKWAKVLLALLVVLSAFHVPCRARAVPLFHLAVQYQSVMHYINTREDLNLLRRAIEITKLTPIFEDPTLVATFFLPSDGAFRRMLNDINAKEEDLFGDVDALSGILLYHIHDGQRVTSAMLTNNLVMTMGTYANTYGGVVRVLRVGNRVTLVDSVDRRIGLSKMDVPVAKAVVHIVDKVMIPGQVASPQVAKRQ